MRKATLLAGAALLLAGPAVAADLAKPVYKAPAFVPGFTWTGCYAGASVGGAWAKQTAGTTAAPSANQADTAGDFSQGSGVIGGPYVGCNYQLMNGLVVGAEGDFSWTSLSGSFDAPNLFPNGAPAGPGGIAMTSDTRWAASLRARLGYAVMPNVLVYGTAGGAWATTDYTGVDTFNTGASRTVAFSNTGKGWVAGGGIEWAPWSNNWILRAEYLHYDLGSVDATSGNITFNFGELKIDTVRAGLSYKF
jgi:outer membrane immunogenic protein